MEDHLLHVEENLAYPHARTQQRHRTRTRMSNSNAIYDTTAAYPRDLVGYGRNPPHARWPGNARIAVQFVLNYEEGGENCVLHGDAGLRAVPLRAVHRAAFADRHLSMESIYEYGSRAGVWRILREFERARLPLTVFGVAHGAERTPTLVARLRRGRPRDRLPRLALDPLPGPGRGHRARAPRIAIDDPPAT